MCNRNTGSVFVSMLEVLVMNSSKRYAHGEGRISLCKHFQVSAAMKRVLSVSSSANTEEAKRHTDTIIT